MGQLELNNLELVRAAGRHSRKDEIQSESESINNLHTDIHFAISTQNQ